MSDKLVILKLEQASNRVRKNLMFQNSQIVTVSGLCKIQICECSCDCVQYRNVKKSYSIHKSLNIDKSKIKRIKSDKIGNLKLIQMRRSV